MKKGLLFLSTLLICKAVFAVELATDSTRTYADELLAGYEKARPYNLDAVPVMTLLVGRCFGIDEPNTPIAAAILIDAKPEYVGPIEDKPKKVLATFRRYIDNPSYYDNLTYTQVLVLPEYKPSFVPHFFDPISNALKGDAPTGTNTFSLIRNDGNYVYQKLENMKHPNESAVCYYFKTSSVSLN